jgi:hypothetical protein
MLFLDNMKQHLQRPVWINADILPGPNGSSKVVDAKAFLDTVTSFFPDVTFSLGWTTGWHPEKVNEGDNSNQFALSKYQVALCECVKYSGLVSSVGYRANSDDSSST